MNYEWDNYELEIFICANAPHMVYDFIQVQLDVPILHIGKAIGGYAIKNNPKNLGLLATKPTVKKGFLEDYIKAN